MQITPVFNDIRIDFSRIDHLYLAMKPVDFRKSIDGLTSIVQGTLDLDPFSQSMFLFVNRQRDKMKAVYYDGTGFWLFYRRLSRGKLDWPLSDHEDDFMEIDHQAFTSLMSGLSVLPSRGFQPGFPKYI